ncbi:MAG: nucleotidyltransferase domain-containing protein [Candidatus Hydrothermarchaeota archaeon]|nr:nucleotidyltransferase domain-containing protein [Candidatus Hydrothermarchaeota archaeon]
MLRIRDFIETRDRLIFAVTSYCHLGDRYVAFLRYYPSKGGRRRGKETFKKVASTQESFEFLEKNFPEHLFFSEVTNSKLQCVPKEKIFKTYYPPEKLKEIYEKSRDTLEQKVVALSELFSEIPEDKTGVSGSILLNLHEKDSDIDFVVYGTKNHENAREILRQLFEENKIRLLSKEEWLKAYVKRFPGSAALSFEEFLRHEQRKFHKGVIESTVFDVLLVRDFDEIEEKYSDRKFRRMEKVKMKCTITDASLAFDSPAIYKVACEDGRIKEVASFTHTYAGQAFDGEEIEVAGFLEEVTGKENYSRIVVGTTREAEGEYIKKLR